MLQAFDSRLAVPAAPSWEPVCKELKSPEVLAQACKRCGSFTFHLARTADDTEHHILCAGCLTDITTES